MTRLQEHKTWAIGTARETGHLLKFTRNFQFKKNNYSGYLASCQHCKSRFVLCIERRSMDQRLSYSDEFSIELGYLLVIMEGQDRPHPYDASGYLPSIFGSAELARFKLDQYFNLVGTRTYSLGGSINVRKANRSIRKKILCKRLRNLL